MLVEVVTLAVPDPLLIAESVMFRLPVRETTTRFALAYGTATGVECVAYSQQQPLQTYDLQGRPVTGILRPGIYISNGKKIIIK